jgi:hypothetical protein
MLKKGIDKTTSQNYFRIVVMVFFIHVLYIKNHKRLCNPIIHCKFILWKTNFMNRLSEK